MTLLAAAAALTIGAMPAGVEPAHALQLGTGSNALGRGDAVLGRGDAVSDTASRDGQQAVAPAATGGCVTNRTAFKTQTNFVSTTSLDYVTMPNTHFPVTTSGGCIIVDFSGMVISVDTATGMYIRATVAGIGAAEPPYVFLGLLVAENAETRSMRFVFPNVPAGQYVVRIEFASNTTGGTVYASNRTLTVQYRP